MAPSRQLIASGVKAGNQLSNRTSLRGAPFLCYNSVIRRYGLSCLLTRFDTMPVYEYRCAKCGRKTSVYVKTFDAPESPACSHCPSKKTTRVFSTFTQGRTDHDRYGDILDDSNLIKGMMANSPKAMAEWNRRMGGEESVAPEYEDMIDQMNADKWPDKLPGKEPSAKPPPAKEPPPKKKRRSKKE